MDSMTIPGEEHSVGGFITIDSTGEICTRKRILVVLGLAFALFYASFPIYEIMKQFTLPDNPLL